MSNFVLYKLRYNWPTKTAQFRLKKELSRFESTYQMSSEDFFDRFEKGELGDKEDYFEWSAMYQMYERSVDRLNILEAPSI